MYLLKLTHPKRLPVFLETDDDLKVTPQFSMKARYTKYKPHAISLDSGYTVVDRAFCGNERALLVMCKAWGVPEPKRPIPDTE